jgi:hypothetical protein
MNFLVVNPETTPYSDAHNYVLYNLMSKYVSHVEALAMHRLPVFFPAPESTLPYKKRAPTHALP